MRRETAVILVFLALSGASPSFARAGTDVSNGGDAAECLVAPGSHFRGFYAADYLLTLGPGDVPLVPDAAVTTVDQSLARIQEELRRAYPELAEVFAEYLADLRNFSDWTRPRIWTPAAHGLVDITDERVVRKLPANCVGGAAPGAARLIQAVIRQARPRVIQYQSDFTLLEDMRTQPLQLSYLLVHEWLWDLTQDPEAIRWANRFLHSSSLERMDSATIKLSLANIGISLRNFGYGRVCERTDVVRTALEGLLGLPCDRITHEQLEALDPSTRGPNVPPFAFDFSRRFLDSFRLGDFQGLSKLRRLQLTGNRIARISGEVFGGLTGLRNLFIDDNQLVEPPSGLFEVLPQLVHLELQGNRIEAIPQGFLAAATGIEFLNLSRNSIREVPADFLVLKRPRALMVSLDGNPLTGLPPGFFDPWPKQPSSSSANPALVLHLRGTMIPAAERNRIVEDAEYRNVRIFFQ